MGGGGGLHVKNEGKGKSMRMRLSKLPFSKRFFGVSPVLKMGEKVPK